MQNILPDDGFGRVNLNLELTETDRKLLEGLKRTQGSKRGMEVRDICANQ